MIALPSRVNDINDLQPVLEHMVKSGGSDLFIMSGSPLWQSRYGRKERLSERSLQEKEVQMVLQSFYGVNATAIIGSAASIDTFYEYNDGERHRFRVNVIGCLRRGRSAITITMRTIPTTPPSAEALGVPQEIIDVCRGADQGLILVVGATGNGKSTLLASVLRDQLEDVDGHRNLVTIEHPIEFVYDEIETPTSIFTQMEVGRHIKSFADGVRNSLRMAPTTILVGESRDYETVSASLEASVTGHVVFSTVHANSVADTCQRMVAVFPEELQPQARQDLIQALKLVVAQRLVPSVDGKRVALREYLAFDDDMRREILSSPNMSLAVRNIVRRQGWPMIKAAEEALAAGRIDQDTRDRIALNYGE